MTQAPEIQAMYNVPLPVSVIRTRMREEFEKHRYINKLSVVDVLLFQSHAEYQVLRDWQGTLCKDTRADSGQTGNDELLEADEPCHVILQGGKLQRRQEVTRQLHVGFPGGRVSLDAVPFAGNRPNTNNLFTQGRN